jgi:hypothetical protein
MRKQSHNKSEHSSIKIPPKKSFKNCAKNSSLPKLFLAEKTAKFMKKNCNFKKEFVIKMEIESFSLFDLANLISSQILKLVNFI